MGRMFPVQQSLPIPWAVAEVAYREYARRYGAQQSMERLAERGGFGVEELDAWHPTWRTEAHGFTALEAVAKQLAEALEGLVSLTRYGWHGADRETLDGQYFTAGLNRAHEALAAYRALTEKP